MTQITTPQNPVHTSHAVSRELPFDQIRPQGWLLNQLRLQADGITGRLEDVWPDVGADSGWLGGPGEDWERAPYYLDGLVPLAHVLQDAALIARATPWIEWMLASQDESGFFGPVTNRDWWPRMVAAKVLIQHADATGDDRVLPFLSRWFRYELDHLPGQPLRSWGRARGADNALSVWWVFERTGEEFLLDLVDLLHEQTFAWNEYLGSDLITGPARVFSHKTHGPNVAMGLKQGAVDYLRDRDPAHRGATERSFAQLERWHGQAHGWFSGDEWLGGREATAGIETCQVVEMMFTSEVLAKTFGGGVYGDRLESLAYNLLAASSDPRMVAHQYHQQANQIEVSVARRDWSYSSDDANLFGLEPHFGCCTANLHQGWPKFARNLWVRDADEGLRVVAYAPVSISTTVADAPVRIDVRTEYPFEETITLAIDAAQSAGAFPVRLRIPEWAEDFTLTIDGADVEVGPVVDGYIELLRDWSAVSELVLVLPMKPRVVRRERQAGSVFLGPLSMVFTFGENWIPVPGAVGLGEWEIHRRSSWNYALEGVEDAASWPVSRSAVPDVPFSLHHGVEVRASGSRATEWRADGAQSSPPPFSPLLEHGPDNRLRLVPYGCARLRITEFPVVGRWASDEAAEF